MDNDKKEIIEKGLILSSMLAGIRALLIVNEDLKTKIKIYLAGVLGGTASIMICLMVKASDNVEILCVLVVSPFISTIFPLMERWAIRITKKKLP